MLKDVLVISDDRETTQLIRRSVSEDISVHAAEDLSTAMKGDHSQCDLIFFDVSIMPDDASVAIHDTIEHFSPANSQVRFVLLTPKR